jgi:hypothetical protein
MLATWPRVGAIDMLVTGGDDLSFAALELKSWRDSFSARYETFWDARCDKH